MINNTLSVNLKDSLNDSLHENLNNLDNSLHESIHNLDDIHREIVSNNVSNYIDTIPKENTISNNVLDDIDTTKINITDKNKNYYKMIFCYFIFLLMGFLGGIFINLISNHTMINFDMLFNIVISPIVYYHSPRNILMNLDKINLLKYYFIPFIIGLVFRFFDRIPGFSQFILDPYYIKNSLQITLLIVVLTIILTLSIYYIYISSNPILNSALFLCEITLTIISCYFYLLNNGHIHIHHYFIGLIIMLVSKNYHSKIVVIAHAISYAIYIEGISGYGFDPLFWKL